MKKILAYFILVLLYATVAVVIVCGIAMNIYEAWQKHGTIGIVSSVISYFVVFGFIYALWSGVLWAVEFLEKDDPETRNQ